MTTHSGPIHPTPCEPVTWSPYAPALDEACDGITLESQSTAAPGGFAGPLSLAPDTGGTGPAARFRQRAAASEQQGQCRQCQAPAIGGQQTHQAQQYSGIRA